MQLTGIALMLFSSRFDLVKFRILNQTFLTKKAH